MTRFIKILFITTLVLFVINYAEAANKKIVINLPGRSLALYDGDTKIRLYPVALGKPYTPTPAGYYKIQSKEKNPTWTDPSNPGNYIPSGPYNPLGYRWMQIKGNYGIHGTNNPSSIGTYASNGCIRMLEENVEELFDLVEIGTPVEITYNRVIVEKDSEGVVVYYVYPDSYYMQDLTVSMVKGWLKGYGVEDFVNDADILAKIQASDGKPTYIAKSNTIILNGERLKAKAVQEGGIMYLPLTAIANELSEKYHLNILNGSVSTSLSEAKGIVKNHNVYIDARDLSELFKVKGELNAKSEFVISTVIEQKDDNIEKSDLSFSQPDNADKKTETQKTKVKKTKEKKNKEKKNKTKKEDLGSKSETEDTDKIQETKDLSQNDESSDKAPKEDVKEVKNTKEKKAKRGKPVIVNRKVAEKDK